MRLLKDIVRLQNSNPRLPVNPRFVWNFDTPNPIVFHRFPQKNSCHLEATCPIFYAPTKSPIHWFNSISHKWLNHCFPPMSDDKISTISPLKTHGFPYRSTIFSCWHPSDPHLHPRGGEDGRCPRGSGCGGGQCATWHASSWLIVVKFMEISDQSDHIMAWNGSYRLIMRLMVNHGW